MAGARRPIIRRISGTEMRRHLAAGGLLSGLKGVSGWSQMAKGVAKKVSSGRGREILGAGLDGQKTGQPSLVSELSLTRRAVFAEFGVSLHFARNGEGRVMERS
jgi:hypothetical protein